MGRDFNKRSMEMTVEEYAEWLKAQELQRQILENDKSGGLISPLRKKKKPTPYEIELSKIMDNPLLLDLFKYKMVGPFAGVMRQQDTSEGRKQLGPFAGNNK